MNLRKLRIGLLLYAAFDLFIGGVCGGFLPLSQLAAAQFTTVTGTVTDPSGLPYANGTITATLVTSASPTFTTGGAPYSPPTQPVGLTGSGSFVMQLADNTQLTPGGSTWTFTVTCGAGCVPLALGKGQISFTVTGVTISGASQSITTTLTAAAPALTSVVGGGGSGTVNSGTATQLAIYNASTNAVSSNPRLTDNGSQLGYTGATGINAGAGGFTTSGSVTGASGAFTGIVSGSSFSWTGNVSAHTFFGNNTGGAAPPAPATIGLGDLPNSVPSTAAGTSSFLPKYTATGLPSTLGNSLASDNGTTLSYTGTGGISGASLTATNLAQGKPINANASNTAVSSSAWIDASVFTGTIGPQILGATTLLQTVQPLGGTVDARGISVAATGTEVSGQLWPAGDDAGGILLLPSGNLLFDNPQILPNRWDIEGIGERNVCGSTGCAAGGALLGGTAWSIKSGTFKAQSCSPNLPSACTGTISATNSNTPTLTISTSFTAADVGTIVYVPAAGGPTSDAYLILSQSGTTASALCLGGASTGGICNAQSAASFSQLVSQVVLGDQTGMSNSQSVGVHIRHITFDPGAEAGVSSITNYSCQENCSVEYDSFTDYIGTAIFIEGLFAGDSGPYDHLTFNMGPQAGGACPAYAMDIQVRANGPNGLVFSNNTFTHTHCNTSSIVSYAVELEGSGVQFQGHTHFEGCQASTGGAANSNNAGGFGCYSNHISIGMGEGITCPVACTLAPIGASGMTMLGVNGTQGSGQFGTSSAFALFDVSSTTSTALSDTFITDMATYAVGTSGSTYPQLILMDHFNNCATTVANNGGGFGVYTLNPTGTIGYDGGNGYPTAAGGCTETYQGSGPNGLTTQTGGTISILGGPGTGHSIAAPVTIGGPFSSLLAASSTQIQSVVPQWYFNVLKEMNTTSGNSTTLGSFGTDGSFSTGRTIAGNIYFSVQIADTASPHTCVITGIQPYVAQNTSGTVSITIGTQANTTKVCDAGSVTGVVFSLTAAHPSVLSAVASWVPGPVSPIVTGNIVMRYTVEQDLGPVTYTAQ